MTTYFAYGSNMRRSLMADRCPGFDVVGIARLPNHRLAFTRFSPKRRCGVADIVRHDDSAVWGVLYSLTADHVASLDRYESVHDGGYRRIRAVVETPEADRLSVMTYEVVAKKPEEVSPSAEYLHEIITGAIEHELPECYLNTLRELRDGFGLTAKLN